MSPTSPTWPQLVRVHDRPDRLDLAVRDVERHDADHRFSPASSSAPGWPFTSTWRSAAPGIRSPCRIHARRVRATRWRPVHARARAPGPCPPPSPCSTTSWASSVSSALELALLGGREEAPRQLVALLARGLEARPAARRRGGAPVPRAGVRCPRSCRRSAAISRVAVVEHVVQQERRPLLRRQALQQHEERERERVGELGLARRVGRRCRPRAAPGATRPRRSRGARGPSAAGRSRAAWRRSPGTPAATRCARACSSASWRRRRASWTTSSASATLPSIR